MSSQSPAPGAGASGPGASDPGATRARAARMPTWLIATVGAVFGLVYAYAVWQAIGNTVQAAQLGLTAYGWFVWLFAIVVPGLAFLGAFALSWRRSLGVYAATLIAGLGLVAVFWLNVVAYTSLNTASLIGG